MREVARASASGLHKARAREPVLMRYYNFCMACLICCPASFLIDVRREIDQAHSTVTTLRANKKTEKGNT